MPLLRARPVASTLGTFTRRGTFDARSLPAEQVDRLGRRRRHPRQHLRDGPRRADHPHGSWKTIDDETGETKSIVKIYEVDGKLYGRVDKLLLRPGALCDKCEGEDYNKPIEGMVVVWGLSDDDGDGEWEGGKVFDPEKNKTYRCKIWMDDGKIDDPRLPRPVLPHPAWLPNG
jgi:hypothetical protein